jgi:hypothetical protein
MDKEVDVKYSTSYSTDNLKTTATENKKNYSDQPKSSTLKLKGEEVEVTVRNRNLSR